MATILSTGWEDYADGTLPCAEGLDCGVGGNPPPWSASPYQDSLNDRGWIAGQLANTYPATRIVSSQAHSGAKSVRMGSDYDGAFDIGGISSLGRLAICNESTTTLQGEAWWKPVTPSDGFTTYKQGPHINFYVDGQLSNGFLINTASAGVPTLRVACHNAFLGQQTNVIVWDVWQKISFSAQFSTIASGGASLNADGWVKVWHNDILVFDLVNQVFSCSSSSRWALGYVGPTNVIIGIFGYMDDLIISNDPDTFPPPVGGENDPPEPDCGDTTGPATGPVLPPTSTAWIPRCDVSGAVPTASDLTDSEDWA